MTTLNCNSLMLRRGILHATPLQRLTFIQMFLVGHVLLSQRSFCHMKRGICIFSPFILGFRTNVRVYYSITAMQRGPEKTVPAYLHSFTTSAQNQVVFSYSLLVSCNINSLLNIFCPRIMFIHFVVQTTWPNAKDIIEKFSWCFPRVLIEARCLYIDNKTACLMIISDYIALLLSFCANYQIVFKGKIFFYYFYLNILQRMHTSHFLIPSAHIEFFI